MMRMNDFSQAIKRRSLSLILLYLCTGCAPYIVDEPPTSADYCLGAPDPTPAPHTTTLTVWSAAPRNYCWRVYAPVIAAENLPAISVQPMPLSVSMNESVRLLGELPADQRPDIAWVNGDAVTELKKDGIIVPVDDCRQRHPIFAKIRPELWATTPDESKTWSVPVIAGFPLLFYNKTVLSELGWSEDEIEQLPHRITTGEFTLDQLIATADSAIEQQIIRSGLGFTYHNTSRIATLHTFYAAHGGDVTRFDPDNFHINETALRDAYATAHMMKASGVSFGYNTVTNSAWTNRVMLHDAFVRGRVLFTLQSPSNWHYWVHDHLNGAADGEQIIAEQIGFAPFPSATGDKPVIPVLGYSHRYVILATTRERQRAACDLLAETMKMENIGRHYLTFKNLSPMQSPNYDAAITSNNSDEDAVAADFLNRTTPLWEYVAHDPHYSSTKEKKTIQTTVFDDYATRAELGELTPDEAAEQAIAAVRAQLGDRLTVTP